MYRTLDKLVTVLVGTDYGSVVFPPSSWSIVNIPVEEIEAKNLFKNLYNTPTSRHISLLVNRHKRKDRLASISNSYLAEVNWTYLDTVAISYEKPSSCSNNGLLPIAEMGHIIYKGNSPDVKNTSWFNEDFSNATTNWDVGAAMPEEGVKTYFQRFSWQLNLILRSMSNPLEYRHFLYLCETDKKDIELIYKFCKTLNIGCTLVAKTTDEANSIIEICNKIDI